MPFNEIVLAIVCVSCVTVIVRSFQLSIDHYYSWAIISGLIIVIALGVISYNSSTGVAIISLIWLIFLIIPKAGFLLVKKLFYQQNYQKARQLALLLRWLHPTDGWWEYPQLVLALETIQKGDRVTGMNILEQYQPLKNCLGRHAQALIYWVDADWNQYLRWNQQTVSRKTLLAESELLIYYLQALGETGQINQLLVEFESTISYLNKVGNSIQIDLAQLFSLAFCGQISQVRQLLTATFVGCPTIFKSYWMATAELSFGQENQALARLLSMSSGNDMIFDNAINWRLRYLSSQLERNLNQVSQNILDRLKADLKLSFKYQRLDSKQRKGQGTEALIGINLIIFLLEIYEGGSENLETLYNLGALVPESVWQGEWWRLISANFLHYGWLHFSMNMIGLYFLGRFVEISLGSVRFLIIYFVSGTGAMFIFSYLSLKLSSVEYILVGASAAIMGLVGGMTAMFLKSWWKNRSIIQARRLKIILFVTMIQFVFDFLIPQISFSIHLLGFMIGFFTCLVCFTDVFRLDR